MLVLPGTLLDSDSIVSIGRCHWAVPVLPPRYSQRESGWAAESFSGMILAAASIAACTNSCSAIQTSAKTRVANPRTDRNRSGEVISTPNPCCPSKMMRYSVTQGEGHQHRTVQPD